MFLAIMPLFVWRGPGKNHVNLGIVNVVDIPSDSDGYSSLETAVPPVSNIGESVLQLFKDAVSVAESDYLPPTITLQGC